MRKLKASALLLSLVLIIGTNACNSGTNKQLSDKKTLIVDTTRLSQPKVDMKKDNVTLKVLTLDPIDWNNYPDNPVAMELKKQTGVTVEYEVADMDKIKCNL